MAGKQRAFLQFCLPTQRSEHFLPRCSVLIKLLLLSVLKKAAHQWYRKRSIKYSVQFELLS